MTKVYEFLKANSLAKEDLSEKILTAFTSLENKTMAYNTKLEELEGMNPEDEGYADADAALNALDAETEADEKKLLSSLRGFVMGKKATSVKSNGGKQNPPAQQQQQAPPAQQQQQEPPAQQQQQQAPPAQQQQQAPPAQQQQQAPPAQQQQQEPPAQQQQQQQQQAVEEKKSNDGLLILGLGLLLAGLTFGAIKLRK